MTSLTSGGGLAGVDMADDDDVDMSLLFTVGNMSAMFIDLPIMFSFVLMRLEDDLTPWLRL